MDFRFDPSLEAFQEKVRAFFREEMRPEKVRGHRDERDLTGFDEAFERAHLRRAGEAGLLGVSIPEEHGGQGKPLRYKAIVSYEAAYHDAPCIDTAATLIAPQMLAYGSPEQQAFYLPKMVSGELTVCIAYTEANAGSDLANLETRADRNADGFTLNGTKTLVTGAHKADYCCLVARTDLDAPRHKGMSMLLVPLDGPGITIERRVTMNRWTLSEIRFQDARVPSSAILGEMNKGWYQMAAALQSERSSMAHLGWATRNIDEIVDYCRETRPGRGAAWQDKRVRADLARLRIELGVAERLSKRVMWLQSEGQAPGHAAAMAKTYLTELLQRTAHVGTRVMGLYGGLYRWSPYAPAGGRICYEHVERVHPTISVGSNEIQRNAIAVQGLGMPR